MKKPISKHMGLTIWLLIACSVSVALPARAAIDEFNGPTEEQMRVDEVKNEVVLYQRIDQRRLSTASGIVDVPPLVTLVDERPPEEWYVKKDAKAVFYYTNDLELIRVLISE